MFKTFKQAQLLEKDSGANIWSKASCQVLEKNFSDWNVSTGEKALKKTTLVKLSKKTERFSAKKSGFIFFKKW